MVSIWVCSMPDAAYIKEVAGEWVVVDKRNNAYLLVPVVQPFPTTKSP